MAAGFPQGQPGKGPFYDSAWGVTPHRFWYRNIAQWAAGPWCPGGLREPVQLPQGQLHPTPKDPVCRAHRGVALQCHMPALNWPGFESWLPVFLASQGELWGSSLSKYNHEM